MIMYSTFGAASGLAENEGDSTNNGRSKNLHVQSG